MYNERYPKLQACGSLDTKILTPNPLKGATCGVNANTPTRRLPVSGAPRKASLTPR